MDVQCAMPKPDTHTHAHTHEFAIYLHFLPNVVACSGVKEKQRQKEHYLPFLLWNTEQKIYDNFTVLVCASMTMTTSERHCCYASYTV